MECPCCGHENSEKLSYCAACAAPLSPPVAMTDVVRGGARWFLGLLLATGLVFLAMVASTILLVVLYDFWEGHRLLVGIGYVLAGEGVLVGLLSALTIFSVAERRILTGSTVVVHSTVFSFASLMKATPKTDHDLAFAVALAGLLMFLLGLVLLGV